MNDDLQRSESCHSNANGACTCEKITVAYDQVTDTFYIVGVVADTYAAQTLQASLAAMNSEEN